MSVSLASNVSYNYSRSVNLLLTCVCFHIYNNKNFQTTVGTNTSLYHVLLRFTCKVFPLKMSECRRFRSFDRALAILEMPPFLCVEHKLLTACFALVFSNSAVA